MASSTFVVYPNEAELMIKEMKSGSLDQVGSNKWWKTHELIQKLNMQAVLNVSSCADEFVKDFLVSYNKMIILIYDLIKSEVWTEKVFPYLKSTNSSMSVYMTLFHEVTVLGLLETSLFYKECCESAGDVLVDLVDYIQRKITSLLLKYIDGKKVEEAVNDDLENQNNDIQFTIQMKVISILRYISDHIDIVPLSVLNRILDKYDMPCMLVQLIENSPWKRINNSGNYQLFTDNKWCDVAEDEKHIVSKLEGQVWITLYQLLLHPECQRKYDFNVYRKSQILKLRRHLNEVVLEQINFLKDFQRFVEMLSVMNPPQIKECLIIEQIPTIRIKIESDFKDKWKKIAHDQASNYYTLTNEQMKERAQSLSTTYNIDLLENLINEPPTCAYCHGEAMKRCSRCQNEWYCSRPCQVSHWNKHKELCNMMAANAQK
ncbi:zinc finger MYND domain-containing protein 10 isoform X4 [Hydra vulgaris]|uniref:Zinc finger MYND domain-containing protein 10 isoform X4 n=1 Tax=Hydra vulgaris TaxID=6087 RepID=A0ABM4D645_HYDVU